MNDDNQLKTVDFNLLFEADDLIEDKKKSDRTTRVRNRTH